MEEQKSDHSLLEEVKQEATATLDEHQLSGDEEDDVVIHQSQSSQSRLGRLLRQPIPTIQDKDQGQQQQQQQQQHLQDNHVIEQDGQSHSHGEEFVPWRTMVRRHFEESLYGSIQDPLLHPFKWRYVGVSVAVLCLLALCLLLSSNVTLEGGITLLWFFNPVATLIICLSRRCLWPYLVPTIALTDMGMALLGHGRVSGDWIASLTLVAPDSLGIFLSTLVLRPIIHRSLHLVRSTTFILHLFTYVLVIVPFFSTINVSIVVLLPSNPMTWFSGQKLLLAWLVGDFFATYFSVYAVLVFRHYMVQAKIDNPYHLQDLISSFHIKAQGSTFFLRVFEFIILMSLTYIVARAVAMGYSDMITRDVYILRSFLLLVSRLMFPILGYVAFRYGQLGSCVALIATAAAIFTYTYFQLDDKTGKLGRNVYYQIDILLAPYMVTLYTFMTTFLATALAEKQDALQLLRKKNEQLLLQGQELNEAKLAAQRALNTKTEFFARVSHEFRTPLNIILNFAEEISRDQTLTPYVKERISYILTSGESLLRIVDDILELFRLSSHRLQIDLHVLDIHCYFSTLCDLVQVITDKNQLNLIRELDQHLPRYLLLDKVRFSQLVMNLTSNASKFTCKGGHVNLRLKHGGPVVGDKKEDVKDEDEEEQKEEEMIWLKLEVEDDGIGIPTELQRRIFDCFYTKGPSTEGHGLGLAITKELVEMMKGKIELQSQARIGSLFTISLPAQVVSDEQALLQTGPAKGLCGIEEGDEQDIVRGLRILVVEDIIANQMVLEGMLKDDSHIVTFVETTNQAMDLLRRNPSLFDVVLLDLQLPDTHGRNILLSIRSHPLPSIRNIVIIVVSAIALDEERQRCKDYGADDFLTKPLRRISLRKVLSRFLIVEEKPEDHSHLPSDCGLLSGERPRRRRKRRRRGRREPLVDARSVAAANGSNGTGHDDTSGSQGEGKGGGGGHPFTRGYSTPYDHHWSSGVPPARRTPRQLGRTAYHLPPPALGAMNYSSSLLSDPGFEFRPLAPEAALLTPVGSPYRPAALVTDTSESSVDD